MKAQHERCQTELRMKEEKIQQLTRDVQNLEDRCTDAEHNVGQIIKMQEDIDVLHGALRDIAHTLIQDAETKEPEMLQSSHIHLSASTPIPQK